MPANRWIFFDCDSTLSAIEGVDELARIRPPEVFAEVKGLTDRAMNGEIPIDDVFGLRLDRIRPTRDECLRIGQLYIEQVEPSAKATIDQLRRLGWTPAILSGGYLPVIRPLAEHLRIDHIEAVDLHFDAQGQYTGFDTSHPNTRNGGKPEVIRQLRQTRGIQTAVMIGDGISDLETLPEVQLFAGFGGFVDREAVRSRSPHFITRLDQILPLLASHLPVPVDP